MIVKTGREYILENGFKTDSITKIVFGDSDEISEEGNITEISLGNKQFTAEIKEKADSHYFTCQHEKKENENIEKTIFNYDIHLLKTADEQPKKISCMGLFNNGTLIARVVFPPIYKKNETELDFNYKLYF